MREVIQTLLHHLLKNSFSLLLLFYFPISKAFINMFLLAFNEVMFASYDLVALIKSTISFNGSTFGSCTYPASSASGCVGSYASLNGSGSFMIPETLTPDA